MTKPVRIDEVESDILLSFEDWEALDAAGSFDHLHGKIELIDGKLRLLAPAHMPHAAANANIARVLGNEVERLRLSADFVVGVNATAKLTPYRGPEPDAVVCRRDRESPYADPESLVLAVEVSASTQHRDYGFKVRYYAEASVPEYWVLDLKTNQLVVHRSPESDAYTDVATFGLNETVSPLFAPDAVIAVRDLV